jgi:hypothetical protein
MQAANAGHSVRPPETDLPDEPELLDELRRQRSQITYVVKELKALPPPSDDEPLWYGDRRRAALALLAERSAELAAVQEDVLWPLAERSLPDGWQWQQRARELDAAGQTRELAAQGPEAEGFADRLTDVLGRCRRQTALEDALYLQLGESVPEEERRALGRRVRSGGHDGEEQSA